MRRVDARVALLLLLLVGVAFWLPALHGLPTAQAPCPQQSAPAPPRPPPQQADFTSQTPEAVPKVMAEEGTQTPPPVPSAPAPVTAQVLVLCIVNDGASYGGRRSVIDLLSLLASLDVPRREMSLGLLASSPTEHEAIKTALLDPTLGSGAWGRTVTVQLDLGGNLPRSDAQRHAPHLQRERRGLIARYRNYLLSRALRDESWVLWIDADIEAAPSSLLQSLMAVDRDIVTPMCKRGGHNYDLNAWRGPRTVPSPRQLESIAKGGLYVPTPVAGRTKHMDQLWDQRDAQGCVPLDSVGGTVLLVRADVHRQGIVFPSTYIVGTTWDSYGWDGIETEGLCYLAKHAGFRCWGLPDVEVVHHAS